MLKDQLQIQITEKTFTLLLLCLKCFLLHQRKPSLHCLNVYMWVLHADETVAVVTGPTKAMNNLE